MDDETRSNDLKPPPLYSQHLENTSKLNKKRHSIFVFLGHGAKEKGTPCGSTQIVYREQSCQKATALAAATLRESTPWDMGIRTV
jgi:hypothetical protein